MLTLYQFPISHFCEKARWALDYKQLNYQVKNLLPGIHGYTTKKLVRHSSVPILVDNNTIIQDSSQIITYLDNQYPDLSLSPDNQSLEDLSHAMAKYQEKLTWVNALYAEYR